MSDTLITIIAIFLAATLMFIVPLMAVAERNDDIAQTVVQSATAEFVDKISIKGKITESDYNEYIQKIESTGAGTMDVEIEVQHLDENFGKKSTITSGSLIGENQRFSTFTIDVMNSLQSTGSYALKKGDNVIITAKNTSKTIAQSLRTFAYKVTGRGTAQIAASSSAMVVNSGN